MCNVCGNARCRYELRHIIQEMLEREFASCHMPLIVSDAQSVNDYSDHIFIIDDDFSDVIASITVLLDSVIVRPPWDTGAHIKAADPEFINKIIGMLRWKITS